MGPVYQNYVRDPTKYKEDFMQLLTVPSYAKSGQTMQLHPPFHIPYKSVTTTVGEDITTAMTTQIANLLWSIPPVYHIIQASVKNVHINEVAEDEEVIKKINYMVRYIVGYPPYKFNHHGAASLYNITGKNLIDGSQDVMAATLCLCLMINSTLMYDKNRGQNFIQSFLTHDVKVSMDPTEIIAALRTSRKFSIIFIIFCSRPFVD